MLEASALCRGFSCAYYPRREQSDNLIALVFVPYECFPCNCRRQVVLPRARLQANLASVFIHLELPLLAVAGVRRAQTDQA